MKHCPGHGLLDSLELELDCRSLGKFFTSGSLHFLACKNHVFPEAGPEGREAGRSHIMGDHD